MEKQTNLSVNEKARILWRDEWGTPKSEVSKEEAEAQGLRMLKGRWVSKAQYEDHSKVLKARSAIRSGSIVAFIIAFFMLIFVLPYFISYRSNVHPSVIAFGICGIIAALASGIAIRWYVRWAYWLLLSIYSIVAATTAVALVLLLIDAARTAKSLTSYSIPIILSIILGLLLISLYRLADKQVRNIFRGELKNELKNLSGPNPLLKGVAYTALFSTLALMSAYTYFLWSTYNPCPRCDLLARATASKSGAAVERLHNEIIDSKCGMDPESVVKDLRLEYLVGPHYQWKGTFAKWTVKARIVGDEIHVCTPHGARLENDERYIYRISLIDGRDLPTIKGKCEGSIYGRPDDYCYESSMLAEDCRIIEPKRRVKCREIMTR